MILFTVIFLLFGKISSNIIVSGFILHTVILFYRAYVFSKYKKNIHTITDSSSINHWIRLFKIGAFMSGLAWGITLFFLPELSVEYHFLIFVILVGLAASGIATLGMIFSIYIVFMLSILGGSFVWMLLQDGLIYSITAFLTLIMIFYNFFAVRRFSRNTNQLIIERERVKEYTKKLEYEHSALRTSEQTNRKLTERMELALIGNDDGLWDWNLVNDNIYFSPRWKEMLVYNYN